MFYVFRDLQKQCINKYNSEILNVRFADNKYISFAAFKRKWFERFAKEREIVKNVVLVYAGMLSEPILKVGMLIQLQLLKITTHWVVTMLL